MPSMLVPDIRPTASIERSGPGLCLRRGGGLIREEFRHNRHRLPAVDLVFYGQPGLATMETAQLRKALAEIWLKVIERCAG